MKATKSQLQTLLLLHKQLGRPLTQDEYWDMQYLSMQDASDLITQLIKEKKDEQNRRTRPD